MQTNSTYDPEEAMPTNRKTNTEPESMDEETSSVFRKLRYSAASILAGVTFIVGFIFYTTLLNDLIDDDKTTIEKLTFIKNNEVSYYLSNIILYIIFGLAQLATTYGMALRFHRTYPEMSAFSQGLGISWSVLVLAAGMIGNVGIKASLDMMESDPEKAALMWDTINTIHDGVGGGNEIVGGCWILVVSVCEFLSSQHNGDKERSCSFFRSKATAIIGVAAGLAGIIHTVPGFDNAGAAFGVSMIIWYIRNGFLIYG